MKHYLEWRGDVNVIRQLADELQFFLGVPALSAPKKIGVGVRS